jgi:recombinational DNA repair protein (RecF pathway)
MKCSKCGKTIDPDTEDQQPWSIKGEEVCKECWCSAFGEEIEKHPTMDFISEKIET